MNHIGYLMLAMAMFSLHAGAFAQNKNGVDTLPWADGISVDGNLADWGANLSGSYKEQTLQYEVRNDADHIFVAVRIMDRNRQLQVIGQGLRFMLNTQGKKRDGQAVIFPVADRISLRTFLSAEDRDYSEDYREKTLQMVRGIYVLRFDDMVDGAISLENQYGFRAMASIDEEDALCIELCIPLKALSKDGTSTSEMAFNIKINNNFTPTQGRAREETGVWSKFILATK